MADMPQMTAYVHQLYEERLDGLMAQLKMAQSQRKSVVPVRKSTATTAATKVTDPPKTGGVDTLIPQRNVEEPANGVVASPESNALELVGGQSEESEVVPIQNEDPSVIPLADESDSDESE